MGIFSALVYLGSLDFQEGLLLMDYTCRSTMLCVDKAKQYGMGAVIGLTLENVQEILATGFPDIEVADVSNDHVVLVSGVAQEIQRLLPVVKEIGAIQSKMLPISLPYHSRFIKNVLQELQSYVDKMNIKPPMYPLISGVDQRFLDNPDEIKKELVVSISQSLNWVGSIRKLLTLGVSVFLECGASDSLVKMLRFMDGDFEAYHPKNFDKFFKILKGN